ncbi:type VI secretion system-associated FHA domain protein TagH [Falsiroseomonas bella]|uniref:Type VI secretion system-associated FHA domain protein TagH n=1 Tax=Falsiroseomonas bella TaxID=2184016 RepID=A0A317FHJ9_9PROT|nr:type VI secretion system-associated FHA domain protein TagH [Falsiroseomonas bella]PWS38073.1 type VI secretion system-associated FHA domain protein TagH [Falsiroseomonas bella]
MRLTLSALRGPGPLVPESREIDGGEVSLGRAPGNSWVLPDPDRHLSKRHCVIAFQDGGWRISDISTNGTFLNDEEEAIGKGAVRELRDGDRIHLGAYEIEVRLQGEAVAAVSQPGRGPAAQDASVAAFLRGAGLPDARIEDPAATMAALGAAFRAMVVGLRAVLIARAATKGQLRLEHTIIRARGNNPLKFSTDDDDAMAALLGAGRRSAMRPAEAVAEVLRDLREHEVAWLAAMQPALRTLLAELSPDALPPPAQGASRSPQQKARAFDALEARHAALLQGLSEDFDGIFGRAFARAYEAELRKAAQARDA